MSRVYPFEAIPLSFSLACLEPAIESEVTREHYLCHYMHYIDGLNAALAPFAAYQSWSLPKLVAFSSALPVHIRTQVAHNAGGVFNHELYWHNVQNHSCDTPQPVGGLAAAINDRFGDFESFQACFNEAAAKLFGSGWTWLVVENRTGNLSVETTANQDTPLSSRFSPLLALDLWEHAYYYQYQSDRQCYIDNWWHLLDWDSIDQLYQRAIAPDETEARFTLASRPHRPPSPYPHGCTSNIEAIPAGESYYAHKHLNTFTNVCGGKSHASNSFYAAKTRSRRKRHK